PSLDLPSFPTRRSSDLPAALYSSTVRSSCTNAVTCSARRAETPGTFAETIRSSLSKSGYSIQQYRQRRFSASCTSRVRFEVMTRSEEHTSELQSLAYLV